MISQIKN